MKLLLERHHNGEFEISKYSGEGWNFSIRDKNLDELLRKFKESLQRFYKIPTAEENRITEIKKWSEMEAGGRISP